MHKHTQLVSLTLQRLVAAVVFVFPLASVCVANPNLTTVRLNCANRFSGGETSECKVGVGEGHEDSISIKVTSSNPGLVLPHSGEVTLAPKQEFVKLDLKTFGTPIKSTVTITASLSSDSSVQAAETIEVVPALISSVTLGASSFVGTHGAKTTCNVKLKAPAPTGGIQLYLSPLQTDSGGTKSLMTFHMPNPMILAGKDSTSFDIEYDRIYINDFPLSGFEASSAEYAAAITINGTTTSLKVIVALDPQTSKAWTTIPGTANAVSFQIVPLRVSTFSVQPSTLANGGEGLASFTLSAPPGNLERALLHPAKSYSSKFWAVPLGASCAAQPNQQAASVELQLTAGTTNYSFKVCSASVTSVFNGTLRVYLRSGDTTAPVVVQP